MLCDRAAAELEAEGPVVKGRVNPWLTVLEKTTKSQSMLATRLRLCPSARSDPQTIARHTPGIRAPWEPDDDE